MAIYNYSEIIQKIDELITRYNMSEARETLNKLKVDKVPSKFRASLAQLARRVGDSKLSLRLLQNNVYGVGNASHEDIIEYSSTLRRLGLINQSLNLLSRVTGSSEAHIHKAFCYLSIWDAFAAEKELKAYLCSNDQEPRKVLVAKVNLVSCYIDTGRLEEANELIKNILPDLKAKSEHLYFNIQELRGQLNIRRGQFSEAIQILNEANRKTEEESGRTSLYIQKWLLIAKCLNKDISIDSEEVREFRQTIRDNFHWETLRDFDWQIAKLSNDKRLMDYVFFGTPFRAFREMIFSEIGGDIWPAYYCWSDSQEILMNPMNLYNTEGLQLPFGMGLHRLWMLLASDFYRPWTIGRIFNSLFPDELYDPVASPKKVYRLIEKLTQFLEKNKIPMTLGSTVHGYRLRLQTKAQFLIFRNMQFSSQEEFIFNLIKLYGFNQSFSKKDLAQRIPMSEHQWYRMLKKMEEMGYLEKSGTGRNRFNLKKVS